MESEDEGGQPTADRSLDPSLPPSAGATVSPSAAALPPGRRLRVVVTLHAQAAGGYRALLAVGADGCDPLLRSVEAPEVRDVLEWIPPLLAEAEARWQVEPRYPAVGRQTATSPPPRAEPPATPPPDPTPTAAVPAPPRPASSGQLSLFD